MTYDDMADTPGFAHYKLATRNRPLRLLLDGANGPREGSLLPQRVSGNESVCGGFEFRILCVSGSATLALKDFIGLPAELQVVTDRGRLRRVCGIVMEAASGQSDGGLATYRLVMRDALAVMEHKTNTRVFRDRNELEIIQAVISEWKRNIPALAATFDLVIDAGLAGRNLPRRQFTMQHNESDADFIRRLMQRRGIAWCFRAGMTGATSDPGAAQAHGIGHTLVLFRDSGCLHRNEAGNVRFHRDDGTEQRDSITGWSAVRTLQPGSVSLHSWNYLQPRDTAVMTTEAPSQADQGEHGNALAARLERYHVGAAHLGHNLQDLQELGDIRMAHYEYAAKWFRGEGGVRDLAVGEWFSLEGHPDIDTHANSEREFVLTSQHIVAENNLPVEIGSRVARLFERSGWPDEPHATEPGKAVQPLRYRTSFTCVRRRVRIVPPPPILPRPELQAAIVVGPENETVWCDHLGRVKIRFLATRPDDHAHANGAGSSDSDRDSAWVRVASGWAGNGAGRDAQCGARLLPPVGTEVLVSFAGADPDKPVIIGQLYNSAAPPPAFVQEDGLPGNRYQSGLRSREARGWRGNQLRLDDTPGQISAQLASDHGASALNLGYLTSPRRQDDARPRGEGAELRTDEAIALRAARGILLSTWKLLGGAGDKAFQLARDDYLQLLDECKALCTSLGDYAAGHAAMAIDTREQEALLARFRQWDDGSNTAPDAAAPREPVIAVTSPSGIGFASSKAIVSYSASTIDTAAQQHLQFTAGQRYAVNAGDGVSLFARGGGLTAVAHAGKLLLQSQRDDIGVNSAKDIQVSASNGAITVAAKSILFVTEDGSFFRLGDGPPVMGSKQALKFHAADFLWDGPETMSAQLPLFEGDGTDLAFEPRLYPHLDGGVAAEGLAYRIESAAGASAGNIGADGATTMLKHEQMHLARIRLEENGE